jgi:hypothetical protein
MLQRLLSLLPWLPQQRAKSKSKPKARLPSVEPSIWATAVRGHISRPPSSSANMLEHVANLGSARYCALAELIWESREEIQHAGKRRVFHISTAKGLLAVLSPDHQLIQILNLDVAIEEGMPEPMLLRRMPASASMLNISESIAFSELSVATLFWLYGQSAPDAVKKLPALDDQLLHVRRFPRIDPALLDHRHFKLIHLLSQQLTNFAALQSQMPPEDAPFLCADLASLYMTGSISLQAPQAEAARPTMGT